MHKIESGEEHMKDGHRISHVFKFLIEFLFIFLLALITPYIAINELQKCPEHLKMPIWLLFYSIFNIIMPFILLVQRDASNKHHWLVLLTYLAHSLLFIIGIVFCMEPYLAGTVEYCSKSTIYLSIIELSINMLCYTYMMISVEQSYKRNTTEDI